MFKKDPGSPLGAPPGGSWEQLAEMGVEGEPRESWGRGHYRWASFSLIWGINTDLDSCSHLCASCWARSPGGSLRAERVLDFGSRAVCPAPPGAQVCSRTRVPKDVAGMNFHSALSLSNQSVSGPTGDLYLPRTQPSTPAARSFGSIPKWGSPPTAPGLPQAQEAGSSSGFVKEQFWSSQGAGLSGERS